MSEKISGYTLVVCGLIVICFALFSVYGVFTAKQKPVSLFDFPAISFDMAGLLGSGEGLNSEQMAMFEKQKAQIKPQEILPADVLNQSSNIAAHLFLMGFVASVGYKIASLGIQFVRPVVVRLKETKEAPQATKVA